MMHESIMTNIRNTEKKEGKCFAVAWPLRPRKDHDRGHDRNGVRSLGEKKKSQLMFIVASLRARSCLYSFCWQAGAWLFWLRKRDTPSSDTLTWCFWFFLVVCDSTQPFFFTDSSDDSTSVLRNE